MKTPRIVQLLPGFAEGDAISGEAVALRAVFERLGFAAPCYAVADRIAPEAPDACAPIRRYAPTPDDLVLLHYGVASPATDAFLGAPGRKVLLYHNITPAAYFRGYDDELAARLDQARVGLAAAARQAEAVWADSAFNAAELADAGIADVRVLPLVFAPEGLLRPPDQRVLARFARPMTNLLFVGRMAPNKGIEELVLAFEAYHRRINPASRLLLVGSRHSCPRYFALLRMLAAERELTHVCFEDFASPEGLAAYYRLADVFVTTSRHEGFGLPPVEAMFHDVPVVARATGGLPEALGSAGVLFDEASPEALAELIDRVVSDPALRAEVLASQARRITELRARRVDEEVQALLQPLLEA